MKMANGGFNSGGKCAVGHRPESRAILGVDVCNESSDSAGLSEPMREQVEQRTGGKVEQQLIDSGCLRMEDVVQAHEQEVELFVPPKPARNPQNRGHEFDPNPNDSEAIRAWKQRMESDEGKKIYRQRAATSETVILNYEPIAGYAVDRTGPQQNQMRGAVVRLGLQPNPLQQGPSQLKPRSAAKQQRSNTGQP